jgi:hypothetical protein
MKLFIFSCIIGIKFSFLFSKYLELKVNNELPKYEQSVFKYKYLDSALFIGTIQKPMSIW